AAGSDAERNLQHVGGEPPLVVVRSAEERLDRLVLVLARHTQDGHVAAGLRWILFLERLVTASWRIPGRLVVRLAVRLAVRLIRLHPAATSTRTVLGHQAPRAVVGHRVLPQLADAARLDLDELLEAHRVARVAALED